MSLENYARSTRTKIEQIEDMIIKTDDEEQQKRLKNVIAARKYRLWNRASKQDIQDQLTQRNQQVQAMMKILSEELPKDLMKKVSLRICDETPRMEANKATNKIAQIF